MRETSSRVYEVRREGRRWCWCYWWRCCASASAGCGCWRRRWRADGGRHSMVGGRACPLVGSPPRRGRPCPTRCLPRLRTLLRSRISGGDPTVIFKRECRCVRWVGTYRVDVSVGPRQSFKKRCSQLSCLSSETGRAKEYLHSRLRLLGSVSSTFSAAEDTVS